MDKQENIIKLCKQVIRSAVNYQDSSDTINIPQCHFCYNCGVPGRSLDTKTLKHKNECAYLIALEVLSNE